MAAPAERPATDGKPEDSPPLLLPRRLAPGSAGASAHRLKHTGPKPEAEAKVGPARSRAAHVPALLACARLHNAARFLFARLLSSRGARRPNPKQQAGGPRHFCSWKTYV
jgi:hypothetical protein